MTGRAEVLRTAAGLLAARMTQRPNPAEYEDRDLAELVSLAERLVAQVNRRHPMQEDFTTPGSTVKTGAR